MRQMRSIEDENQTQWIDLVTNVGAMYQKFNIAVTLSTEVRVCGVRNRASSINCNVGLQFDIVHSNNAQNIVVVAPTHEDTQPPPYYTTDVGIADQLEKLNEMHQKGHLTDEEYGAAKAKILSL